MQLANSSSLASEYRSPADPDGWPIRITSFFIPSDTLHMNHLTVINMMVHLFVSLVAGRILTVFWSGSFTFRSHGHAILSDLAVLLIGLSLPSATAYHPRDLLSVLTLLLWLTRNNNVIIIMEGEKMKATVTASAVFAAMNAPRHAIHLISIFGAVTQIVRKPDWLKDRLMETRVICGPIHPIMVVSAVKFIQVPLMGIQELVYIAAVTCTIPAVVFLRPGSTEMLSLIPAALVPPTLVNTFSKRRLAHGVLNVTSVLLMGLNAPDFRVVAGICCAGLLLHYLFVKFINSGASLRIYRGLQISEKDS